MYSMSLLEQIKKIRTRIASQASVYMTSSITLYGKIQLCQCSKTECYYILEIQKINFQSIGNKQTENSFLQTKLFFVFILKF